jgi:hypothetical protein
MAAALRSHARCRQLLREGALRSAKTTDPEIRRALRRLDIEAGRLEAYWHLVLRCSSAEQWRRASARIRRLRRLIAPLTDLPSRGAARVAMDAELSSHPKRARAARRAAQAIADNLGGQRIVKQKSKIADLLKRDADAWRSLPGRCPGLDDAAIETSLLRGLLGQPQQRARKQQKRVQRLIWQLELIGVSGADDLGPLLSDLRRFGVHLSEQHAVAAFAARLDRLPLQEADQRRLERAVEDTLARLHGEPGWPVRCRTEWPRDRLAATLRRELRRWAWQGYLEDGVLNREGF